eukprot:188562_1
MASEKEYAERPNHPMPGDDDNDSSSEDDIKSTKSPLPLLANKKCGQRTCSVLAHNKMVFHALKHLSRPVIGLLIGITYKDKDKTFIHVMDAIPLQHNFFSAMVIEVAFLQITQWLNTLAAANKIKSTDLRILGVYFSNAHADDVSKNTSALIIASQLIREYSRSSTLLCEIQSERIESAYKGTDSTVGWSMLRNNGDSENRKDWKEIEDVLLVQTNRPNTCEPRFYNQWLINLKQLQLLDVEHKKFNQLNLKQLLKKEVEEKIYDFEDHLDDQSKDWRNLQLFDLL